MVSEAGPSTCSTRPLLRIKRVPTCQYLQNLLLSGRGGRSIAARRAIDGVRFFAHLSEEPMSESRRCPPFTEMGGGAPVNGHHAVSPRMVTYAKKEFDKQS